VRRVVAALALSGLLVGCVQHQWAYGPTASMPFEQASGQCKLTAMGAEQGYIAIGRRSSAEPPSATRSATPSGSTPPTTPAWKRKVPLPCDDLRDRLCGGRADPGTRLRDLLLGIKHPAHLAPASAGFF
jgi:hypothetical protein